MNHRVLLMSAGAVAVACAGERHPPPGGEVQRGIAVDVFRTRPTAADFAAIHSLGVTHVALFPFGFMRTHTDTVVHRFDARRVDWSLTDEALLTVGRLAAEAGLQVVLLPTLVDFLDGHWRGEVQMADEQAWAAWFSSYRAFLMHYARLADQMGAVGLSVGTELRLTVGQTAEWRETIVGVRERFRGWITYAANWDDFADVPWWDAVDLIGVQAYFELGDPPAHSVRARRARLEAAWRPIKRELKQLSDATGRRVLFTEIGYKSHSGSTAYPWKWDLEGEPDLALQAAAYEAAFNTFWPEPWFAGFYWWKWHPQPERRPDHDRDFTPQGKPAQDVIRRWYSSGDAF